MKPIKNISPLVFLFVSLTSNANMATQVDPVTGLKYDCAYVSPVLTIEKQEGWLWCWAASISTIFKHYGHPVAQSTIVTRIKGVPIDEAGWPAEMTAALSTTWVDLNGETFKATCQIHDMDSGTSTFNNSGIMTDLKNNKPILYCNSNHAMVLVAATSEVWPDGNWRIVNGQVLDPSPMAPSPRFLNPMTEGFPRFAARIRVK